MAIKKTVFFFFSLLLTFQLAVSQVDNSLLMSADSLFEAQKYTESYEVYEKIYKEKKQFSNQMLLKMAYIKEGLGDYANALYYLEHYYRKTNDAETLTKIRELAEEENLNGYTYSDTDYLLNTIINYKTPLLIILLLLCLALSGHLIWTKKTRKRLASLSLVLVMIFMAVVVYLTNFRVKDIEGIVIDANAYLMKEPSAAADIESLVEKGDKLKVERVEEIWTAVKLDEDIRYVKTNKLGLLH